MARVEDLINATGLISVFASIAACQGVYFVTNATNVK